MINVTGLEFSYKNKDIIKRIDFHIEAGDCVALLGTNGVGKSTLLKTLNKLLVPTSGSIQISNQPIEKMKRKELAKKISYVEQHTAHTDMTVYESVLLGRKPYTMFQYQRSDYEQVETIIKKMELEKDKNRSILKLSGGERQKVSIARALVQDTDIILFDEPTSNLDPKNQQEILSIINDLHCNLNKTIIITLHDINQALSVANKFLLLKDGKVLAFGDKSVLTKDNLYELYNVHFSQVTINKEQVFFSI